jgi:transposase InsO family protein
MPTTLDGKKMFLLLVDDFSRFMWIMLLPSKDGAPEAIKRVRIEAETATGKKINCLHTDRGSEFSSNNFTEYCTKTGVCHELMALYSPQKNGVVEHRNQSVVSTTQSMMKEKHLLGYFWGEAVTIVRNTTLTLIKREDDTRSWGNFLVYFSHNAMPT